MVGHPERRGAGGAYSDSSRGLGSSHARGQGQDRSAAPRTGELERRRTGDGEAEDRHRTRGGRRIRRGSRPRRRPHSLAQSCPACGPSILSFDAAAAGTQGVPFFRNVTSPFPSVFSATDLDINVTSGTGQPATCSFSLPPSAATVVVPRRHIDDPSGWTLIDNAPTSDVRTKAWDKLAAGAAGPRPSPSLGDTTGGTEWALGGVIARFGNAVGR